jgi:hypothetical protein
MSRAVRAAEFAAELVFGDGIAHAVGIHLGHARGENDVDTRPIHQSAILIEHARVQLEVVFLVELRGVDEDRGEHDRAIATGGLKERGMSGVQRAHRRHETDHAASRAVLGAKLAPFGHRLDNPWHG